jgi:hypothetical protein
MSRFGDLEKRLAAVAAKAPKRKAASLLPPGLEWIGWTSTEEIMLLEQLLRADADGWPTGEREPGVLLWTEIETAARRRQVENWPDADHDHARYAELDRARNYEYLTLAERLRTSGSLSPSPPPSTPAGAQYCPSFDQRRRC